MNRRTDRQARLFEDFIDEEQTAIDEWVRAAKDVS